MGVALVIFTLDEVEGMKAIMPQIKREWYDELIIVDGGSTDGTFEYAQKEGHSIFRQKGPGLGTAFTEVMDKVTADIVITFSPDGNSLPEKIPELVSKINEGFDLVTVSRYLGDAKSYDDDWLTAFGNWMFTALVNLLFRTKYTDLLVMYRGFRKKIVKELGIYTTTPSWGTLLLLRATKRKLKVGEIPGDEPKRISGERKMRPLVNGTCELFIILKEFIKGTVGL
ncbi:MAG: glycosyltransferase family 2 protein [Candidatus Omnitrophica bacterium]|nr:glycosyltransferase family 2 protein [Candidatus Omnitrophota bacterium]